MDNESTTIVSKCGQLSLLTSSLTVCLTCGVKPSSRILSSTPVLSYNVSTNKIARLAKGDIFDSVDSRDA